MSSRSYHTDEIYGVARTSSRSIHHHRPRSRYLDLSSDDEILIDVEPSVADDESIASQSSIAAESKAEDDESPDIAIFSIPGISGEHASLNDPGLTLPGTVQELSFDAQAIVGAAATNKEIEYAAIELLDQVMLTLNGVEKAHHLVLVFLAYDFGGTILKKALCLASKNSRYSPVLNSTSLLIFFGTPHRASANCPWDFTLSRLIYAQFSGLSGPWVPRVVRHLSAFHEALATEFDSIDAQFNVVNYYQQESDSNLYNVLVEKFAATLNRDSETEIGLQRSHNLLGDFYIPKDQDFLVRSIEDSQMRARKDYLNCLHLLSMSDLHIPTHHTSGLVYKNLCDWILSADLLNFFRSSTTTINFEDSNTANDSHLTAQSEDTVTDQGIGSIRKRSPQSVERAIQILAVGKSLRDITLMSSLIASIKGKRSEAKDVFVTLAQSLPHPHPLSKTQLLACLSMQLLIGQPRSLSRIKPMLKDIQSSVQSYNSAWKLSVLWRCLKLLLYGHDPSNAPGQTFVIIDQPDDVELASPFLELVGDLTSLLESTEVACKILVLRKSSVDPVVGSVAQREISLANPDVRAALKRDYEAEFSALIQRKPQVFALKNKVLDEVCQATGELSTFRHIFAILEHQPLLLLQPSANFVTSKEIALSILNLVPESFRSWVQIGLLWVTHAIRPLSCAEFSAVLRIGVQNADDSTFHGIVSREFEKLLCGLVAIDGGKVCLVSLELSSLLAPQVNEGINDETHWFTLDRDPHFDIARSCVKYIKNHMDYATEPSSGTNEPSVAATTESRGDSATITKFDSKSGLAPGAKDVAPLLQYSIEHWFTHVQRSSDISAISETFVREFLEDQPRAERLLELFQSIRVHQVLETEDHHPTSCPSPIRIAEELGIDLAEAVDLALHARGVQSFSHQTDWSGLTIAVSQLGKTATLQKIIDGRFLVASEPTVLKIFETSSDKALCYLARVKVEFVRANVHKLLRDAIQRGNSLLVDLLLEDFGQLLSFDNYYPPLLHVIAESGSTDPSQRLWELQKPYTDYRAESCHGRTPLHLAAMSGDITLVSRLIAGNVTIDSLDSSKASPLFLASRYGHFTVVMQLLAAHANVHLNDKKGQTPLHTASANGYADTVTALIASRARLDARDSQGRTPLHLALENNQVEVALILLKQYKSSTVPEGHPISSTNLKISFIEPSDPDVNSRDSEEMTPLILATKGHHNAVIKALLGCRADLNLTGPGKRSALHQAAKFGFYDVFLQLLNGGADPNLVDDDGISPLHSAAARGHVQILEKILAAGVYPPVSNPTSPLTIACRWGQTQAAKALLPFYFGQEFHKSYLEAASSGWLDTVEVLLNAGADIDAQDSSGCTALHLAVRKPMPRLVKLLLSRRAQLEKVDNLGRTPLLDAARQESVEILRMLIEGGADLEMEGSEGITPLYTAAIGRNHEAVDVLLEARASLRIPSAPIHRFRYGTFLELALVRCNLEVFRVILRHVPYGIPDSSLSPDVLRSFLEDAGDSDIGKIRMLLDKGFNPNIVLGKYGTMLHYAALWGKVELANLLSEKKPNRADINSVNRKYETSLQVAAAQGDTQAYEIIKRLLEQGASVTKGGGLSGAPLHAAARMQNRWYVSRQAAKDTYLKIVKCILNHDKSTANQVAGYFGTALHAAAHDGTTDMVQLLLDNGAKFGTLAGAYGTPLHAAAHGSNLSMIDAILDLTRLTSDDIHTLSRESVDVAGRLPLHLAALRNDPDLTLILVTENATMLSLDYQGRHALHFACSTRSLGAASMILAHHPSCTNDKDIDGWTPLHYACRHMDREMIKLLIDADANKRAKTNSKWRPLDIAKYHCAGFNDLLKIDDDDESPVPVPEDLSSDEEERLPVEEAQLSKTSDCDSYHCDGCGCPKIYGPRYTCQECNSFDFCFKCFRNVNISHYQGHKFERFDPSGESKGIIDPWSKENPNCPPDTV